MKIAVLSCIHANLPALEALLKDIEEHKYDRIYSLGDLVGYSPHPNEVIDKIKALNIPSLRSEQKCNCYQLTILIQPNT